MFNDSCILGLHQHLYFAGAVCARALVFTTAAVTRVRVYLHLSCCAGAFVYNY
jgi:hypothetical protein